MANDALKQPIEPGFLQRAAQGIRYMVRGAAPESWFGPSAPQEQMAPENVRGRAFDYPVAANLQVKPRSNEGVSFEQLRALADHYDLVRLAINTRRDQMCKIPWSVQPREVVGHSVRAKPDQRCADLEAFLRFPDRINPWSTWLRMLLEDVFVIDAPTVYPRRTADGQRVYALEIIDGATIKPILGYDGRRPLPPDPAYAQILKGVPAVNYTADELVYMPRNKRSHKMYGQSEVEQIMMTVNVGIRRQISQLHWFTEGNVPEALCGVPADWQPSQIKEFQDYWDSILEGNSGQRRHMKFVPGDLKVQFTKDAMLKDQFDEWLARVVCYAFSLPPTAFVQQQNRATAQTAQEAALQEGLAPLMVYVKDIMDLIINRHFGFADLEFTWKNDKEIDPPTKASMDLADIRQGVKSIDEVRQERGEDPLGIGHIIFGVGPAGFVFVEDLKDPAKRAALLAPPQPAGVLPPDGAAPMPSSAAPGAPVVGEPAPSGAAAVPAPEGLSPGHHEKLTALHNTLQVAQPALEEVQPRHPLEGGVNEKHQAALDAMGEVLGMEPRAPAVTESGLSPSHTAALTALAQTLGKLAP